MTVDNERRLDIPASEDAMERWRQLQAWGQQYSYPVPGKAADGSPVWTLWRWTGVVNAERAAEACRLVGAVQSPPSPGSSAKAARITPADRRRIDAQTRNRGAKNSGKPTADQQAFF